MASNVEKQRGRNVVSKPLREATSSAGTQGHTAPTASSKSRSIPSSASNTSVTAAGSKAGRAPSTSSIVSSKSSVRSNSATSKAGSTKGSVKTPSEAGPIKVTKVSSTTVKISSAGWTSPAPIPKEPPPKPLAPVTKEPAPSQPAETTDTLQIAAQVYPWTYMTSTLDACFKSAEESMTKQFETGVNQLEKQESEVVDQRERLEAKRAIEFYDELESDTFAKEAPVIMQLFQSHGEACDKVEAEALKLANRSEPDLTQDEPLKPYQSILDHLEELQGTATKLQELITKLTEKAATSGAPTGVSSEPSATMSSTKEAPEGNGLPSTLETEPSARTQIATVFSACLPVLKARIANLSMAQDLMDMALENASLSLKMESMGLTG